MTEQFKAEWNAMFATAFIVGTVSGLCIWVWIFRDPIKWWWASKRKKLSMTDNEKNEANRLRKVLRLLDRIVSGDEETNGTEPEEIQIIVEKFASMNCELKALRMRKPHISELARELHQAQKEIADLKAQLATALADRRNMIYVNTLLRDRPDLGNRAKTVDALIKENTELQRKVDNLYESALAITKVGARAIAETTDLQAENDTLKDWLRKMVSSDANRIEFP